MFKLLAITALSGLVSTNAFAPLSTGSSNKSVFSTQLHMSTGIYYSTSTGNTETVAGYISAAAGGLELTDIGDATAEEIAGHESLIVGAPTWNTGADEQRSGTSWDDWLYNELPNMDLDGKKIAIFGVGDQESYGDNFCDAAGELYDLFKGKGCKIFGLTSQEGYVHEDSKAITGDQFVGLLCDEDNQYDLSEGRATEWIAQLKTEGFF